MAFQAGQSGNPNGRPKGSKNKIKLPIGTLGEFIRERPDLWNTYKHPLEVLLEIASDEEEKTTYRITASQLSLEYLLPKMPANLNVGSDNNPVEFVIRWQKNDDTKVIECEDQEKLGHD